MRKAIGAVCITVLCAALLTGCSNTAGSVSESLNEENSSSSQQAYSEEISDNESNDLIAEAEEALEQGRYEEAVEKSVKGYLMKEDSTGFETITLRVAEKLAEEQGFDNPMASKEETFDKKYYEIAIKCDSFKGKDIGTLSEEQLIEVYKELDDAFFEPISKSCYMASNQRYLFSLGDIYCNGKWYDVFLGEDVGLENSVNVISDSEKSSQQKVEKQNTKSNATHNKQTVSHEYKNALSKGLQYANQLHMSKKAMNNFKNPESVRFTDVRGYAHLGTGANSRWMFTVSAQNGFGGNTVSSYMLWGSVFMEVNELDGTQYRANLITQAVHEKLGY